jgi:hypothetical protein
MREGGAEYTTQIVKGGVCGSGRHSSMEERLVGMLLK